MGIHGIWIDRSDAYLSNLTVTGGSGSGFEVLVGVYDSRLRFGWCYTLKIIKVLF